MVNTSKVRTGTVVGVLALPLIAALAIVMFFAWGQSANDQAQAASQGTAVAMELRLPANVEVGSTFTISVAGNLTPSVPIHAFGLDIITSTGVTYNGSDDCGAETKGLTTLAGLTIAVCLSQASAAGGHLIAVRSSLGVPPMPPLDVATDAKVVLAQLSYRCDTLGTKKITLTHESVNPDGALFLDSSAASVPIKTETQDGVNVADSATVTCAQAPIGGIAELAEVAGTPLDTQSSSSNAGVLAGTIAGIAALAVTLTGAAWYARRRWVS